MIGYLFRGFFFTSMLVFPPHDSTPKKRYLTGDLLRGLGTFCGSGSRPRLKTVSFVSCRIRTPECPASPGPWVAKLGFRHPNGLIEVVLSPPSKSSQDTDPGHPFLERLQSLTLPSPIWMGPLGSRAARGQFSHVIRA